MCPSTGENPLFVYWLRGAHLMALRFTYRSVRTEPFHDLGRYRSSCKPSQFISVSSRSER
jgi:hypothetical protein